MFTTELLDDVTGRSRVVAHDQQSGEQECVDEPPSGGEDTPDSGLARVFDSPVIADGRVIVASDGAHNDGDWEYGGIFTFDTRTGALE
ncbi:hypothetical protein [Halorubrum sp. HHNYT27]|uniref:hypothetical protein n=1 Tax=Halorubrum sp. HHNYT27 TaxID=3402275 RepID=UPI003EBE2A0F